jgi:hypothetical protein
MGRTTFLILGILAVGCSDVRVNHDHDPSQDFSLLKTWAWAPGVPQADGSEFTMVSSLAQRRIRNAVTSELAKRQYSEVGVDQADFWVREYAAVGHQLQVDPGYGFYGFDSNEARIYDEGTIIIDVITPKDKKLVWRGTARGAIEGDLTPKEREQRVQEAVSRIFEKFPPEKK